MVAPDHQADATLDEVQRAIDKAARKAFEHVVDLIRSGVPPRDAIAGAFESFTGDYADRMAEAFSKLLGGSFGRRSVLDMPVGDLTLSERMFKESERVSAEVTALVREHAKGVQQARELALAMYDGYLPKDAPRRPLDGAARVRLPKALRALVSDVKVRGPLSDLIEKGQAQAARLKTQPLRAAYTQALKAWEDGAAADRLKHLVDIAAREKTRYFANRIAQTELAAAHQKAVGRELMADKSLSVVQVVINPTHPRKDICDLHARADLWGLGPGCYPKEHAPRPTFHPFCRCKLRGRFSMDAANAKRVPNGEGAYLRDLDEDEAAAVMGSKEKAERVMNGEPFEQVLNDGVKPAYHLARLGDKETPATRRKAPPPGSAPPAPPVAPPAPVSPARKPFDTSTPAGKWHAVGFDRSAGWIRDAVLKTQAVAVQHDAPKGAWARRGTLVEMDGMSKTDHEGPVVWRHEFGHILDYRVGSKAKPGTYRSEHDDYLAAMRADADRLLAIHGRTRKQADKLAADAAFEGVKAIKAGAFAILAGVEGAAREGVARRFLAGYADRAGIGLDDFLGFLAAESFVLSLPDGVSNPNAVGRIAVALDAVARGDVERFLIAVNIMDERAVSAEGVQVGFKAWSERGVTLGMLSDLVGAATRNKVCDHDSRVWFGHSTRYYKEATHRQGTETFANLTAIAAHESPVWWTLAESFAPNMARLFRRIIDTET